MRSSGTNFKNQPASGKATSHPERLRPSGRPAVGLRAGSGHGVMRPLLATAVCLMASVSPAFAQLPLNTGYNHAISAAYPVAVADNYWINIASFPSNPLTPAVSRTLPIPPAPWAAAFTDTRWISARNTVFSPGGTTASNPAYTIFRKCFCLLPNFTKDSLWFEIRGDDRMQVWVNSIMNVALPPSTGNFGGPPQHSLPSAHSWFQPGLNCVYVLLEDVGGHMGFDLVGSMQAIGLAPLPAFGVNQTFNCPCTTGHGTGSAAQFREADQRAVRAIVRVAEDRRLNQLRSSPPRNR